MEIEVDPLAETPLYQQLRDRVVEAIAAGALGRGDPLASVREVAASFGINVATVAKGYDLLRQEGLVVTNRRSGTRVARARADAPAEPGFLAGWRPRLTTLLAEALAQGVAPGEVEREVRTILDRFDAEHENQGEER